MATIIIPTPLRKFTNQISKFSTQETTVKAAISDLIFNFPEVKNNLLDEQGQIRGYINIFVEDADIRELQNELTPILEDSTVSIIPAIAGGSSTWQDVSFNKAELIRYDRHIIIPEFGINAQKKLKAASVLVIGSGGLGSPLLMYLAAAGVGNIGIVDFDVVDESNLHRQVLFGIDDVGRPKVEAAKEKLLQLNPHINITTYDTKFTSENALDIIRNYDVVADGTDNYPTRYLVNDASVLANIPNVYASIFQFEGQVSVFNYTDKNGNKGPNYRDLFSTPPDPSLIPNCAEAGVLGVLPGIIGSIQASEVIKVITGVGDVLSGRFFVFDASSFESRTLKIKASTHTLPITRLIDYEQFCGLTQVQKNIKEITVQELESWLNDGSDIQIIDVREPVEYAQINIGAKLIPLSTIIDRAPEIEKEKKVVVHCKLGGRSAKAIQQLEVAFGYTNLYNLKGGIVAIERETELIEKIQEAH